MDEVFKGELEGISGDNMEKIQTALSVLVAVYKASKESIAEKKGMSKTEMQSLIGECKMLFKNGSNTYEISIKKANASEEELLEKYGEEFGTGIEKKPIPVISRENKSKKEDSGLDSQQIS